MTELWNMLFQIFPMEIRPIVAGVVAIVVVLVIFRLVKIILDSLPFL